MKMLRPFALLSGVLLLAGCSSMAVAPESGRLPLMKDAVAATGDRFAEDVGPGITRVRIPSGAMASSTRRPVTADIRSRPIRVDFVTQTASMGDLVDALSASDVQIAFRWQRENGQAVLQKTLPFTRFNGTMGGLLDALRTGMGIVSWQEGDLVFLSDADQYTVSLPQDSEIIKAVSSSISSLGATDIVESIEGGQLIYTAAPAVQDENIRPFLQKTVQNLSTINLQVAIVSLALTDQSSQGFDWSKFAAGIDTRPSEINAVTAAESGSRVGDFVDLTANGIAIGTTSLGTMFGVRAVASVAGAIDFLSTFGNTNVTQNVHLRTLSGKEVKIRSGQDIPYVKNVGATSDTGGNVTGSSTTETVKTGLTVGMTPRFDAASSLVTVDVSLDLTSVLEFVELNAGNQLGTLTQPRIQEQSLNDIVQMRAGQTAVIGGLQYDQEVYNGSEPTILRDVARRNSVAFGSRKVNVTRTSLFIILRPTVTIYEGGDFGALSAGISK